MMMSLTPDATGNSSSLADHHGLKILTPIHCRTEDRINKWKADFTVKPTKYPTVNRGFIPTF
jgi:hypothetical protein